MKTKSFFKYSFWDIIKDMRTFYLVFFAIIILSTMVIGVTFSNSSDLGSVSGADLATFIFLFLAGIGTFKNNFHFALVNSVPRKNLFLSNICNIGVVSLIMSLICSITSCVLSKFINSNTTYSMLYNETYTHHKDIYTFDNLSYIFSEFVWTLCFCITMFSLGYLLGLIYYNINKTAKTAVNFGIPLFLFMVLPLVDIALPSVNIFESIIEFLSLIMGIPYQSATNNSWIGVITLLVVSIVFTTISYLIIRRTTIKKA